ncbi:MAG: S41 family peptidase [Maricaulis sp.]|jgi:hypothetical protein|nr:S41 family peptidase [Maricaulis sp.]MDG2044342.1 S41 family peptidase [Maricaulis sp.]
MKTLKTYMITSVCALALAACSSESTATANAASNPIEVTVDWQSDAMQIAAEMLEAEYIYADTGVELATYLQNSVSLFSDVSDREEFAQQLTLGLFEISNDKHLRVFYDPETEGQDVRQEEAASATPSHIQYCRTAEIEYQILAGNFGYIQFPRFFGDEAYKAEFDTAIGALSDTDGMVLDLRDNCGGGPDLVRHLSTYFFAEPTHLVDTEFRGQDVMGRWTYDEVPGERYLDRPLIILTNGHTFSAAESFTFGMKVTGRAQTAGEGTGGGGHFGSVERLTPDFTLFVPVGRTFDPRTGLGWEAEGIQPDVEASSDDALEAALAHLASQSVD